MNSPIYIIQEDSGVPLKFFDNEKWELAFWGEYRLLDMFQGCRQDDLERIMKRSSRGKLPFTFGYGAFFQGEQKQSHDRGQKA